MDNDTGKPRLAAILAADAAGYSRLMAQDEVAALASLDAARNVFRSEIELHRGRVIDMAGDSILAVFGTAAGAVNAALAAQRQLEDLVAGVPADRRMRFRIGVHLGDVIEKADGTVYGDGVNIAARLEGLALPGGVTVSDAVLSAVRQHVAARFEDLGEQHVKNIADPVRVYRVIDSAHRFTDDAKHNAIPRGLRWRKQLWWATPAAITLVAAAAYGWMASRSSERTSAPPSMSVAVVPFRTSGDAPDPTYAEAFTRDLAALLGQATGSSVAAYDAVTRYRNSAVDMRTLAKELNVRYLIDGDVGRRGESMVTTVSLIDALQARQLRSSRIETPLAKVASWPGLPAARATQAVRVAVFDAELPRIAKLRPQDRTALEHAVLGIYDNDRTLQGISRAKASCDEALRLDSQLPAALVCTLWVLQSEYEIPSPRFEDLAREANALSRRALTLASDDANTWDVRAFVLGEMQHQWEAALEANARAVRLDPSRTGVLVNRAILLVWMGRPEESLPVLERATDIETRSTADIERTKCRAYLALGRYEEAIASCEHSASEEPHWAVHAYLAVAYAQLGDMQRAAAARERMEQRRPEFSIDWYARLLRQITDVPQAREQYEKNIAPGLRKAGFREK
jgi:adenylate cyclase